MLVDSYIITPSDAQKVINLEALFGHDFDFETPPEPPENKPEVKKNAK